MRKLALLMLIVAILFPIAYAQQCDYKVEILLDGNYFTKDNFTWKMMASKLEGTATNISAEAAISDSTGKTAKSYSPWKSLGISRQKTSSKYSPNLQPGNYGLSAEIKVECDDSDLSNNIAKGNFIIRNSEVKSEAPSKEEPAAIIQKQDEFLQNANESGTEKSQSTIDSVRQQSEEPVESNSTKSQIINQQQDTQENNFIRLSSNEIEGEEIDSGTAPTAAVVFESSSEKSKNLALVMLLAFSIILNIVLIWKR